VIDPKAHRDLIHLAPYHPQITINLIVCKNCGFIFHDNILSLEELQKMYEQEDRITHKKETLQKRVLLERALNFLKRNFSFEKANKVIDIGSGDFSLLERLVAHAPNAQYDAVNVSYSEERRGSIRVFREMLEDMSVPESYNIVILSHILEHIADFDHFFRHLSKLLAPDACLYVEVPFQVGPTLFLKRGFHAQHINYFSPWTLDRLLGKYGFKLNSLEFDTEGGYFYYGIPGIIRAKYSQAPIQATERSTPRTSLLKTLFYLVNPFIFIRGAMKTHLRKYGIGVS
jgi:SAM-dependent methyltransferase